MSRVKLGFKNWNFSVDKQTTLEAYEQVETSGAESCGCDNCLNFAAQRTNVYPNEIKELLTELGINWMKEVEVSHYARTAPEQHYYSGRFHFLGTFDGKNCEIPLQGGSNGFSLDLTPISETFSIGFRHSSDLTAFSDKNKLVQIEFECKIPWVLTEKSEPD
ncbi:hypothetical protein GCM10011506_07070 [Marivirga lumbricoides]|uniref:Uncharacterized protein n=1 Tax=Marivirga lumbricoides TaxID=1046115 RepID=A0A2T4DTT0_9BACT|nr:hypothetical protein C9994_03990 [Marivirga lumbricoides]GGC24395.1 hypothetical protein GCM10011506_07070 [Marivirga lumbricoides]